MQEGSENSSTTVNSTWFMPALLTKAPVIALKAASTSNVEELRLIVFHSFGDLQIHGGELKLMLMEIMFIMEFRDAYARY